jgi:catechol 2,3-dioxygenase-like lactoylglutathione lyase family enzyme
VIMTHRVWSSTMLLAVVTAGWSASPQRTDSLPPAPAHSAVKTWAKPPTTQPWGTRFIYFRDPDGNLVDFYTPPKVQQ